MSDSSRGDADETAFRQLTALELRAQQPKDVSSGKGREGASAGLTYEWNGSIQSTFQTPRRKLCVLLSRSGQMRRLLSPAVSLGFTHHTTHCVASSAGRTQALSTHGLLNRFLLMSAYTLHVSLSNLS